MSVMEGIWDRLKELTAEIPSEAANVAEVVSSLQEKFDNEEFNSSKGISFLEMKCHLLLNYLINLAQVMLVKCEGKSIKGNNSISRLVEIRVYLERIRPIEQRLKYQIDKLVKMATTGHIDGNDPLHLKPNPENLVGKLDVGTDSEDEAAEVDDAETPSSSKKYVPPKMAAARYEEEDTMEDRKKRLLERAKKRALGSQLMRELTSEFREEPEEIVESRSQRRTRIDKEIAHRQSYEEEMMVRVSVPKRKRQEERQIATMSGLDSLTNFGDAAAILQDDQTGVMEKKLKRRKTTSPRKGKKWAKGKKGRKSRA